MKPQFWRKIVFVIISICAPICLAQIELREINKFFANIITHDIQKLNQSRAERCALLKPVDHECAAINTYPRPNNLSLAINGGNESPLCVVHLSGLNKKKSDMNNCSTKSDRYSPLHVANTQADMASSGFLSLTTKYDDKNVETLRKKKSEELFTLADRIRSQVAVSCCGRANTSCINDMVRVEVELCAPPSDTNEPDPCTDEAYYTIPQSQIYDIWDTFDKTLSREKSAKSNSPKLEASRAVLNYLYDGYWNHFLTAWYGTGQKVPVPGKVVLSPYFKLKESEELYGDSTVNSTLEHEFYHACDYIKAQQKVLEGLQKPDEAYIAIKRLEAQFLSSGDVCQFSPERKEYFRNLWMDHGETKDLAICLEQITENTQKQDRIGYCQGACQGSYLSESYAQMSTLLAYSELTYPATYPITTCFGSQDSKHPLGLEVFECAAQFSEKFRKQFKKVFRCVD
jgi:hypothetical protein